jgi:hypothetical protein
MLHILGSFIGANVFMELLLLLKYIVITTYALLKLLINNIIIMLFLNLLDSVALPISITVHPPFGEKLTAVLTLKLIAAREKPTARDYSQCHPSGY